MNSLFCYVMMDILTHIQKNATGPQEFVSKLYAIATCQIEHGTVSMARIYRVLSQTG